MKGQEETVINPEILKSLGKVQGHFPIERPAYDPSNPKGDGGIVKANDPPKRFEFGIEPNLPKK